MTREKAKEICEIIETHGIEVIKAYGEGKTIQHLNLDGEWVDCDMPISFVNNHSFRVKPEENYTIKQNAGENQIEGEVVSISGFAKAHSCNDCLRHRFCYLAKERKDKACSKISLYQETEKQCRPFKDCSELINHCGTKNIWVESKFYKNCVLQITGYSVDDEGNSVVWLTDSWITLEKLFDDWLFLDDSPCGLEK